MYNKILVPLDGSEFAECALSHAKAIGSGCHVAEVIFLRVFESVSQNEASTLSLSRGGWFVRGEHSKERDKGIYSDLDYADHVMNRLGQLRAEAQAYVDQVAAGLVKDGIAARGEVVNGKSAETILEYAEKNGVDLVIMSTHGASGISRFAFGSTADRVARHIKIPILLVTPKGCRMNLNE